MSFMSVGGTVLAVLSAELHLGSLGASLAERLDIPAPRSDEVPERTTAVVLRTLGLPPAEAEALARRPLPEGTLLDPAAEEP